MAYGLTIYNDNNEIQVDNTYMNFSLHDSGSWSASKGWGWYDFAPTPNPPVVAVSPPGGTVYLIVGQFQKNANGEYCSTKMYIGTSATVPYIVFTQAAVSEIPSGAYGLAIYNASGDLVFHNHNKWCRIISNIIFPNVLAPDCSSSTSVNKTVEDADNNYFLLRPLCEAGVLDEAIIETVYYSPLMRKVDSTTLEIAVGSTNSAQVNNEFCRSSEYLNLIEINV